MKRIRYYSFNGHVLRLRSTGNYSARNSELVEYRLTLDGEVIFEGADYDPSPMIDNRVGVESARDILTFLTCRPGDTDDEYFEKYTSAQLEWCKHHAENLATYAYRD